MIDETAVLATFTSRHMGEVARGYLTEAGVPADLFSDSAAPGRSPDVIRPARLVVPRRYVARAREVLNGVYGEALKDSPGTLSAR